MTTKGDLRSAIERDLKPARPLLSPAVRVLALAPIAVATMIAVPGLQFFRSDVAALGVIRTWGLSMIEAVVGLTIVALALRESIPGRALSSPVVVLTFVAGLAAPFAMVAATAQGFDVGAGSGDGWGANVACFRTSLVAALPALLAATILVARAFPLRPGIAGALYGLGCGVMADAGLRLFCEYSIPSHFIPAHAGPVAAAMLVGAAIAPAIRRP